MLVFLVGVLATSHQIHQQPEELALLLTVGLTAFSLSDNRTLNCLSGLFLPLMLSCKVVTIWPAIFPLLLVLATRERPRILRVGASWAAFTAATALFYIFVIPQEIAETRNAAMNQGGSWFDSRESRAFVRNGVWSMAHIPFYLVAFVCACWLLWRGMERKPGKEWLLALGAIAIAAPPVFIQSLHISYHYLLFFPAAFLVALWATGTLPDAGTQPALAGGGWSDVCRMDILFPRGCQPGCVSLVVGQGRPAPERHVARHGSAVPIEPGTADAVPGAGQRQLHHPRQE